MIRTRQGIRTYPSPDWRWIQIMDTNEAYKENPLVNTVSYMSAASIQLEKRGSVWILCIGW